MDRLVFAAFSFHWRLAYADRSYCVSLFSCYFFTQKSKSFFAVAKPSFLSFLSTHFQKIDVGFYCTVNCYDILLLSPCLFILSSFAMFHFEGNQTFVGAVKNGGTPWGLNKPHRNLEFTPWNFGWIFKLYTKKGLIGEFLSCLFFAFSLKSNCTDFSRERNTHEWYHKIT